MLQPDSLTKMIHFVHIYNQLCIQQQLIKNHVLQATIPDIITGTIHGYQFHDRDWEQIGDFIGVFDFLSDYLAS